MKAIKYLLLAFALMFCGRSLHAQIGPLPCGGISSLKTFRPEVSYTQGAIVFEWGVAYQSLINSNKGNDPCASPSYWSNNLSVAAGNLGAVGTPTNGQYAVWTGPTTLQGQNGIPYSALTNVPNFALLASPAFTGTPTAPTQACGSNTYIATGAYVAACSPPPVSISGFRYGNGGSADTAATQAQDFTLLGAGSTAQIQNLLSNITGCATTGLVFSPGTGTCSGYGFYGLSGDVLVTAAAGSSPLASVVQSIGGGPTFASQVSGPLCNTTGTGAVGPCTNTLVPGFVSAGSYVEMQVYNVPCNSNTPVFDLSQGNIQVLTLTSSCGAITSSSVINPPSGNKGRPYLFWIIEDATGNHPFPNPTWANNWTPVNTAPNSQAATLLWFTASGNIADNSGASQCLLSGTGPLACGTARTGYVVVPAGTNSTIQVNTTAMLSGSGVLVSPDQSVGSLVVPSVTCDVTEQAIPVVSARNVGNFTIKTPGTTTAGTCVFFTVVN